MVKSAIIETQNNTDDKSDCQMYFSVWLNQL